MSRFVTHVPLRWADLDVYRHVNHARAVTLLEEARVELVFHQASEHHAGEWSAGLLVVDLRMRYKRQIPYHGQSVRIEMWTNEIRGASFRIGYEMREGPAETDRVAVVASTLMAPYDMAANRPRRLTGPERAFLDAWIE